MFHESHDIQARYAADFYQAQVEGSLRSAQVVVPQVLELFCGINSVVDIGCGTGAWLSVFEDNGVADILGIDGGDVPDEQILIDRDHYLCRTLTEAVKLPRRFDLAISIEVAEHLAEEYAEHFVDLLCGASDIVVFGAAIPGQGGHHHINERWPSYWAAIFAARGYRVYDLIRPRIWDDNRVEWWYRQNTLLLVKESRRDLIERLSAVPGASAGPLDIVHPHCFLTFRGALERYTNPAEQLDALDWARMRINENHRQLCESWLAELRDNDITKIALLCAGGNAGLGPYLIGRCSEMAIEVVAYIDQFPERVSGALYGVPVVDFDGLAAQLGELQALLIASPGYAEQLRKSIDACMPAAPIRMFGSTTSR